MTEHGYKTEAATTLRTTAKILVFAFFIFIMDQSLILAGFKFGIAIRPIGFYAAISCLLLANALLFERSAMPLKQAWPFFAAFACLVVLGAVMYRGEAPGPNYGAELNVPFHRPSSIGYVIWPALNLIACVGLYLLARHREFQRTILLAAFTALALQSAAMEADMWWPAIFGDPNGRAGGLAQNANVAAVLVSVLAALTLPVSLGNRVNSLSPYALMIAAAAVLFSQSKTGAIDLAVCAAFFALVAITGKARWPHPVFTIGLVLTIVGTAWLSPVLNPTAEQIEKGKEIAISRQVLEEGHLPPATLDAPVPLSKRIESRASLDEPTELRWTALRFFSDIFKQHPLGLGTGFTNKFVTGPHNEWLKLAVDEGFIAPILLTILLAAASWQAIKIRSPVLGCISLLAWLAAGLYHTMFIEPLIPAALAMAMGMAQVTSPDRCIQSGK